MLACSAAPFCKIFSLFLVFIFVLYFQILDQLFSISLSLPKPAASCTSSEDKELSYRALSSLEDVIAILKNVSSLLLFISMLMNFFFFAWFLWLQKKKTEILRSNICFPACLSIQDTSIDPSEVFNRIVSSLCILLTKDEAIVFAPYTFWFLNTF